jgi:sorbitol-6-phosphate 2-dehydrogenase
MKNSWLNLEGKVAIVTGGAAGIGRQIAVALAENGCKVVVADIDPEGENFVRELNRNGNDHIFILTDVRDRSQVENMTEETIKRYGKIDILVNNAGINIPRLLVDPVDPMGVYELKEEEFDLMVQINQKGAFLCSQAVARQMIKQRYGVIINISSESGLEGSEGQSCYAGTKGALYAFTRSWAKELGKYGIRVVGVAPGILEKTRLRSPDYERALAYVRGIKTSELDDEYEKKIPLRRVGTTEEVANLVCFLASDRASYIHGVTYNISGGKSRG